MILFLYWFLMGFNTRAVVTCYQSRFNTLTIAVKSFKAFPDIVMIFHTWMLILRVCELGSVLPAHRAVLVARCDVMAAMFSGKYAEARSRVVPIHGVSSDTFLSFLEYLYTDSCCPGEFTSHTPGVCATSLSDNCLRVYNTL